MTAASELPNPSTPGAIALVGSGEYTDAMNSADTYLIQTLGGPTAARVALLPTASGLEANGPSYWNNLGRNHFKKLDVADIRPTLIVDEASANAPAQLDLLRDANFFYLSGGNPQHIITTLRGSQSWAIITDALARGAVLAGCSAGAMAMSGQTVALRFAFSGGPIEFVPSLGVAPRVIVFPHFDRMLGRIGSAALRSRLIHAPQGLVPVGVDEDTALVRLTPPDVATGQARWRVMGRQTVTLFWPDRDPQTLHANEEVTL